jgi:hypothetical protein
MYQAKMPISNAAEVKAILGPDFPSQIGKMIDHIDKHCKAWIERCPFIVIASINSAAAMDTSPKGDPPGFVKVRDTRPARKPPRRYISQRSREPERWYRFHRTEATGGCACQWDSLASKRPGSTRRDEG